MKLTIEHNGIRMQVEPTGDLQEFFDSLKKMLTPMMTPDVHKEFETVMAEPKPIMIAQGAIKIVLIPFVESGMIVGLRRYGNGFNASRSAANQEYIIWTKVLSTRQDDTRCYLMTEHGEISESYNTNIAILIDEETHDSQSTSESKSTDTIPLYFDPYLYIAAICNCNPNHVRVVMKHPDRYNTPLADDIKAEAAKLDVDPSFWNLSKAEQDAMYMNNVRNSLTQNVMI